MPDPVLGLPPFELGARTGTLTSGGRVRRLRPKAAAVLRYLVEHAGEVCTHEDLRAALWPGLRVTSGVLKVYVWEIRQALRESRHAPRFVQTIPQRGYPWIAPVAIATEGEGERRRGERHEGGALVGRRAELATFHRHLEDALGGARQIVFVTGEPGIGKTTLVEAFLRAVGKRRDVRIASGQCIERAAAPVPRRGRRRFLFNLMVRLPGLPEAQAPLRELARAIHLRTEGNPLFLVNAGFAGTKTLHARFAGTSDLSSRAPRSASRWSQAASRSARSATTSATSCAPRPARHASRRSPASASRTSSTCSSATSGASGSSATRRRSTTPRLRIRRSSRATRCARSPDERPVTPPDLTIRNRFGEQTVRFRPGAGQQTLCVQAEAHLAGDDADDVTLDERGFRTSPATS